MPNSTILTRREIGLALGEWVNRYRPGTIGSTFHYVISVCDNVVEHAKVIDGLSGDPRFPDDRLAAPQEAAPAAS